VGIALRRSAVVVIVLLVGGALGLLGGLPLLLFMAILGSGPDNLGGGCGVPDPTTRPGRPALLGSALSGGLDQTQLGNAAAIITEGTRRRVPRRGIVVALAVASQESGFRNYANDGQGGDLDASQLGIERSLNLPHEAVGTDHGSLGVFQQQWPWWGTMTELMTPTIAAGKFYQALARVPHWQQLPVTVAGQAVQRSAYPDAYADDQALALALLDHPATTQAVQAAQLADPAPADTLTGGLDCVPAVAGGVVFPLPPSTYTDRANWGGRGGSWARSHTGTDLSAPCGTPVRAATSGRVIVRTDQPWAGRWLVQVSTGRRRLATWYAHMQTLSVASGDHVGAGEQLGQVGALGNATGCHLHFEVHPLGGTIYADNINPTPWLAKHVGRSLRPTVVPVTAPGGEPGWNPTWTSPPTSGRGTVRVVSYNIRFGQKGLTGVARDLAATRADIIGLQEVDRRPRGGVDQARWLADRLNMYVYYGPNATWPGKQRGNAILSRYPLTAVNLRLPRVGRTEPRGLIWARVNVDGTVLNVFVTHLHFAGTSRTVQARAVAGKIGTPACGTLLLGDLNSAPHTAMHRAVIRHLADPFATGRYGPGRTAPAHHPRARIDYILHSTQLHVRHAGVRPAGASDHRAVSVTLSVPGQASCAR
jgi:endonuclease/exonuclease/phosphatase family metal-dependent hydrolase/murein DD-endopeptidase MepM/ murein hydrolase activator NlpD